MRIMTTCIVSVLDKDGRMTDGTAVYTSPVVRTLRSTYCDCTTAWMCGCVWVPCCLAACLSLPCASTSRLPFFLLFSRAPIFHPCHISLSLSLSLSPRHHHQTHNSPIVHPFSGVVSSTHLIVPVLLHLLVRQSQILRRAVTASPASHYARFITRATPNPSQPSL